MKNPRTNSKIVRNAVKKTIEDCIDVSEETIGNFDKSENKFELAYNDFKRVANHKYNLQKFPSEQARFKDYLQGLPSIWNLPYYNDEIIELMESKWQLKQPENKSTEDSLNLFYYLIYVEFKKLVS